MLAPQLSINFQW